MYRRRLWESTVGLVENLSCPAAPRDEPPVSCSPDFQVCLPYRGLFVWHVGTDQVVADPNQVLFVTGGEAFRLTQPAPGDYAELIVTPEVEVLAEIARASEARLPHHPHFRRRSRVAAVDLLNLRARFLHAAMCPDDSIAGDEFVIAILQSALTADGRQSEPGRRTARLIRRAKEFVQEHVSGRLHLRDVARATGASPAYLTDVFR